MPSSASSPARVSIRDIAKLVGVSIMTVSLALRNNTKISPETRRRVSEAAERLGYRPDPEIARLMTRLHDRRHSGDAPPLALVDLSPARLPSGSEKNYCARVRRGAEARAESLGYITTYFHQLDYDGDLARLLKVIHYRGIRGILLLPPLRPVELPAGLDWSPFSVIAATYAITPLEFHRVGPDQFIDMCRLIRLLEARGNRRVGAVFEQGFEERTHYHFTAALKLLEHGDNILRVKSPKDLSPAELSTWLRERGPDVLVCPFASELDAVLHPAPAGTPSPRIVSLGAPRSASLPFWDERPEEIGADAAVLLAGMIQHNETGVPDSPRTSMIHGAFHEPEASPAPVQPRPAARSAPRRGKPVAAKKRSPRPASARA